MTTSSHGSKLQILGLEWAAAEHAGNVAALESLLTEDFLGIGPHGFTLSKKHWLARYADGDLVHASFTWDVEVVRDYDAAAVLTGVQEQQSTYRARAVDGRFRASLFLVDQADRWHDVNVMALGELRDGLATGHQDVVFVKVGTGIGAGLVSRGRLHRGAQGCAGDIGHMAVGENTVQCRCGQLGCLEALAGGYALGRDGLELARSGQSPVLAGDLAEGHEITAQSVVDAALRGDPAARRLVTSSARLLGEALARVVNFFNPSLVLIGGGVASVGDLYLRQVRLVVLDRSLPLATRSLEIVQSPLADHAGLRGAAFMVVDELLSPAGLSRTPDRLLIG